MKALLNISIVAISLFGVSCNQSYKQSNSANNADAIYFGGDIITMEGDRASYAEAIAIKDGKIVFAGSHEMFNRMVGLPAF